LSTADRDGGLVEVLPAGGEVVARRAAVTASLRRSVVPLTGVILGGVGLAGTALQGGRGSGDIAELGVLAGFALVAGLWLSFTTPNPVGLTIVINPAISFTFAILLSWGLVAALSAHLAALAAVTWRHRLPAVRALLLVAQFVVAFSAASGVLIMFGHRGPTGREWISPHDAAAVAGACVAWLLVYLSYSFVLARVGQERLGVPVPGPTLTGLIFNGSLVALSPAVAVTADTDLGLAALVLVPLYATQRMARLSVERLRSARVDPLTSLLNRATLGDRFDQLATIRDRQRSPARQPALLLVSLDRFKYINDSLGFETGDQVLVAVASRLAEIHGGAAAVARLGADEFAILAEGPDQVEADDLVNRSMEAFSEPFRVGGLSIDVNASIGLAARATGEDFADVLRHADTAMYDVKRRGGGIGFYRGRPGEDSAERLQLLTDFRRALTDESDEVAMFYQPQVSLATGAVDSLEALLRWTHPVRGPIDATTIIGLAEQTAVMRLLTARVIALVTAQLASWCRDGLTVRVAINISARDLYDEDLVARLRDRLDHHRLPAHLFQVEITEGALLADPAQARATLNRIAGLGIDISLDDFGTGYSTLQNLHGMPLSELKVDQSFVMGMTSDERDRIIVAATIELAHALGLRAVAEGVADEPTCLLLAESGCDLGQGWFISHAVPPDRVPTLIAEGPAAMQAEG
jgi:diguanylate cyclase (GGDEF)-like protein